MGTLPLKRERGQFTAGQFTGGLFTTGQFIGGQFTTGQFTGEKFITEHRVRIDFDKMAIQAIRVRACLRVCACVRARARVHATVFHRKEYHTATHTRSAGGDLFGVSEFPVTNCRGELSGNELSYTHEKLWTTAESLKAGAHITTGVVS